MDRDRPQGRRALATKPSSKEGDRPEPGDVPSHIPAKGGMQPTCSPGHIITLSAFSCRSLTTWCGHNVEPLPSEEPTAFSSLYKNLPWAPHGILTCPHPLPRVPLPHTVMANRCTPTQGKTPLGLCGGRLSIRGWWRAEIPPWALSPVEWGDPFCSIFTAGAPVLVQHFCVEAGKGELSFLRFNGNFKC